jgi:SAM-dependent methyltransferase
MAQDLATHNSGPATYEHRFHNGRRFHGDKQEIYSLPDDQVEADRLYVQHRNWDGLLDGKLALAPLRDTELATAVDIGCGTGIWAADFAHAPPALASWASICRPWRYVPISPRT